jgi:iron complex transport system permease protein
MKSDLSKLKGKNQFLSPLLLVFLMVVIIASLGIGRYPVSFEETSFILFSRSFGQAVDPEDHKRVVIEIVRLPRIILVVLVGMGLAMSGAAMQGVFRNPLVGPEVAGVSAGACFGGALSIILGWNAAGIVIMAFLFGFSALAAAFVISRLSSRSGILGLILAGVIISSFFSALSGFLQYAADPENKLPSLIYWLMGSFAGASYERIVIMSGIMIISGCGLLGLGWRINILSLGENDARAIGVNTERLRWTVVSLVALIVAGQVAVCGGIGWVGLVVPHLARMIVGPEHSRLLPVSGLLGGIYLLLMDDLARTISPSEIPIGILTSMVGTPLFIFLFLKIQKKGWNSD